jgi:hypothetical protein
MYCIHVYNHELSTKRCIHQQLLFHDSTEIASQVYTCLFSTLTFEEVSSFSALLSGSDVLTDIYGLV